MHPGGGRLADREWLMARGRGGDVGVLKEVGFAQRHS